jgi:monoamine oxidase
MDASLWTDGALTIVRQPFGYDGSRDRLAVVNTGKKGDRIDQLPPKERGEYVVKEIERLRPSTKGKMEVIGVHSWPQYQFVEGCRHSYSPGQVTRYAVDMIKPHGRLHFAGEHTRRLDVGMESAMESGERAAVEVVARFA